MAKDPNYSDVSLLLHFDGPNESTAIVDSSSHEHVVAVFGNAAISTATTLFGKPMLLLDGTGDYLVLPDHASLEFGSSDLTIQLHIKTTQTTAYACPIGRDDGTFGAGAWGIVLNGPASGAVQFWSADYSTGGPLLSAPAAGINDGTTHHVEVDRSGSNWYLFVDGVQVATATWSGSFVNNSLAVNVGRQPGYARDFAGNLGQLRITNGVARNTSGFTPPTAPYLGAGDLSGVVEDESGTPAARLVIAIREDTGVIVGSATSDGTTGEYSIPAGGEGAHTLVAYPDIGESLPALVLNGVLPV